VDVIWHALRYKGDMTTLNALGFFLLGVAMMFLPAVAPAYFTASALDGSNSSALWLNVMGLLQGSLGTFFILRNETTPLIIRLMTLRFPTLKPAERTAAGFIMRPLQGGYMDGQSNDNQRLAA
jgi:hypothetical protein